MAKKKGLSYEEKMIEALESLPSSIVDNKHRIVIVFENDRARSNESRFDHIILARHELLPRDIKRIPKGIKKSLLKKDEDRTNTYNLYIKRNNQSNEYIKISIDLNFRKSNMAKVKTIFVTRNFK